MDQTVEIARSTLDAYETWARSKGVEKVETILEYGSPRTVISRDIPEEYNIDLILLGATGLNAVERVFIGSVSEYVVRNADCDVLIVRTPLDEDNDEEIISSDSGRDL
jgi:nucleotide-binding universal stress UspA family protein